MDYSKWDNIDISDDEGEDCHPNIDKQSWIKWKKEARQIKKKEDRDAREIEDKQFQDDLKRLDVLEKPHEQQGGGEEEVKEKEEVKRRIEKYKERREHERKHPGTGGPLFSQNRERERIEGGRRSNGGVMAEEERTMDYGLWLQLEGN